MQALKWEDILEILPPLILLFVLAFSPGIMRFLQKKIFRNEKKKKALAGQEKQEIPQEENLPEQSYTDREFTDTAGINLSGMSTAKRTSENPALQRVENLPPLQKAVIWSEILGPPGGKGDS